MSRFKIKVLHLAKKYLTNRVENSAKLLDYVKNQLFLEQLEERPDDIYIVTFMKSGTTWMQMICYQLLTDGDMGFDHIYDVSPWLTNASLMNVDPQTINKLDSPRFFKCHDGYDQFDPNSKSKFIYVHRNGEDVAISLLHHLRNYNDPGMTMEKMYEDYFSLEKPYNWFSFTESWLKNEYGLNILYISYSDLKNDFDSTVRRIAQFLEVPLTDEIFARVKERSSFEFMKVHETKFGEQPKDYRVYNQFIREGKVGSGKQLSPELHECFLNTYKQVVRPFESKLS